MTKPVCTIIIVHANQVNKLEAAVSSIGDEYPVLILDSGINAEETTRVFSKHTNVRVKKHTFQNDFSELRSSALDLIDTDWAFFLDSDERFSHGYAEELNSLIHSDQVEWIAVKRRDIFLNKTLTHGEQGSTWFIRGVKKNTGSWHNQVHEVWKPKHHSRGIKARFYLNHYPHDSVSSFLEKLDNYTTLLSEKQKQASLLELLMQTVFFPPLKFLNNFVLKLGFLDGYAGLVAAYMMSLHSLILRVKLLDRYLSSREV